jgi:phosphonate transport system substrate-binding protein
MNDRHAASAGRALLFTLLAAAAVADGAATGPGKGVPDQVRMGYSTGLLFDVSLTDAEAALTLWARAFAPTAGFSAASTATIYDDLGKMADQVRAGALDFVALSSLAYLQIQGDTPLEPALVSLKGGKQGDRQLLLVHREGGLRTLAQLRGKNLALLRSGDDLALLWLDTLLARQGLPRAVEFMSVARQGTRASGVLLPVFFRQTGACVVNANAYATAVELNPQLGRDLTVLARSVEFPLGVMCVRPALGPERKQRILAAAFQFLATPTGRQVLTLFKTDAVARYQPGTLDGLESLLREHDALAPVAKAKGEE